MMTSCGVVDVVVFPRLHKTSWLIQPLVKDSVSVHSGSLDAQHPVPKVAAGDALGHHVRHDHVRDHVIDDLAQVDQYGSVLSFAHLDLLEHATITIGHGAPTG